MRRWALALVAGAIAGATIGVTAAAFSSTTTNPGNSFSAAASFCPGPSSQTVFSNADSHVRQNEPATNWGTTADLDVRSSTANNRRSLVRFPLPAPPVGCSVTNAKLRLFMSGGFIAGRVNNVYRLASSWSELAVTWSNQPATTGSASSATTPASGWVEWTVTSQTQAMYSGANDGFLVRDSVEDEPLTQPNKYSSREGANPPELVITFG